MTDVAGRLLIDAAAGFFISLHPSAFACAPPRAASKFFQAYRDWCGSAGRKPQSQTAFKRALEKLSGVYQQRSSSGLQWHGIQPCLAY